MATFPAPVLAAALDPFRRSLRCLRATPPAVALLRLAAVVTPVTATRKALPVVTAVTAMTATRKALPVVTAVTAMTATRKVLPVVTLVTLVTLTPKALPAVTLVTLVTVPRGLPLTTARRHPTNDPAAPGVTAALFARRSAAPLRAVLPMLESGSFCSEGVNAAGFRGPRLANVTRPFRALLGLDARSAPSGTAPAGLYCVNFHLALGRSPGVEVVIARKVRVYG